jgi:hypothetical protein
MAPGSGKAEPQPPLVAINVDMAGWIVPGQERRYYAMDRFLIEVPHKPDAAACLQVVDVFLQSGSHFLTNADWGCLDGEHKAWIIVDCDSREDAECILPPAFRSKAKIVRLNKFTMDQIEKLRSHHRG